MFVLSIALIQTNHLNVVLVTHALTLPTTLSTVKLIHVSTSAALYTVLREICEPNAGRMSDRFYGLIWSFNPLFGCLEALTEPKPGFISGTQYNLR